MIEQTAQTSSSPPSPSQDAAGRAPDHVPPSPTAGLAVTHTSNLFALLDPIPDASHTRNRSLSPPNSRCFEGTRAKVIKKVRYWIDSSVLLGNPHIMWIYGYAGCGKSAIAQVVAESMSDEGRLAGSFFFFRGSGDRGRIARFATTIVGQMIAAIPATERIIEGVVRRNRGLLSTSSTSLSSQFQHLIYDPINEVKWDRLAASLRHGPFLIVLDGVDECEDRVEIAALIEHMIQFFNKKARTPLRFLITSRVENHLYQRLHSSKQVKLLNLIEHTSDADISTALDVAIANEKRGLPYACEASWPCREDRDKLVEHIGGSYIFMTTLIRLLFEHCHDGGQTPMQRLPILLDLRPDFDSLYDQTLAASQGLPHFHDIIRTIALAQEPLSITQIAELLDIDAFSVSRVLVNLHSVMQVPGDDHSPVTLWHTSLRDFLCSEDRSGSFFAVPTHHQRLAYRCVILAQAPSSTPSRQYSQRFAIEHLDKSVELTNDGSRRLVGIDDSIVPLLDNPVFNDGKPAIEVACWARNWSLVRALIRAGANVNVHFRDSKAQFSLALHVACYFGYIQMIYFLLERGASPNIVGPSAPLLGISAVPLVWAAHHNHIDVVKRLLACGADPNLKGGDMKSALHACVWSDNGTHDVVHILLEGGADPNAKNRSDETPLHIASYSGVINAIQLLLDFGADPNVQNKHGQTPLHLACLKGQMVAVEVLLDHSADPSIKDKKGSTALQVAQELGFTGIVTIVLHRRTRADEEDSEI